MENNPVQKKRYYLIDSIRGICIWGMIIYHTLFDVVMMFGKDYSLLDNNLLSFIRDLGAACFVFISGMCFHFEKHYLKRVIMINTAGLIVTGVTFIIMPEMPILFGILTFMGFMSIIMKPLDILLKKINPYVGIIVSLLLFLFFFSCFYGYSGFYGKVFFYFPDYLYKNMITAFLGFPYDGFMSSDYYPVMPWCFAYFCGYYFWKLIAAKAPDNRLLFLKIPGASGTGKYSLYIYLAHQPVIYGLVYLVYLVIMYKTH